MKKFRLPEDLSIPQLMIEFVSVVFAVLLALGLNTYKQSSDQEEQALAIQKSIVEEFKANLQKVDSVLLKNEPYMNYLDSVVRLGKESSAQIYFAYEFEMLTDGAWEIALNTTVTQKLDQEFLASAADIYQLQKFFQKFSHDVFLNIGVFLSQQSQLHESDIALSMYYNIGTITATAEELKIEYEKFLKEHEEHSIPR